MKIKKYIFLFVISLFLILIPNVASADTLTKEEFISILKENGYTEEELYESSYYTYLTMKKDTDLPQFAYYSFTSDSSAKSYINELYNEVEEYDISSKSTFNMDEATLSSSSYFDISFTNNDTNSCVIASRIDNTIIVGLGNSSDREEIISIMKDLDYYVDVSGFIIKVLMIIGLVIIIIVIITVIIVICLTRRKKNNNVPNQNTYDNPINNYQNINLNNLPSKLPVDNYNSNPDLIPKNDKE